MSVYAQRQKPTGFRRGRSAYGDSFAYALPPYLPRSPATEGLYRPSLARLSQRRNAAVCKTGAHFSVPPHDYGRTVYVVAYRPRCRRARMNHRPGLRNMRRSLEWLVRNHLPKAIVLAAHLNSLSRGFCACITVYEIVKDHARKLCPPIYLKKNRAKVRVFSETFSKTFSGLQDRVKPIRTRRFSLRLRLLQSQPAPHFP